MIEAEPGAPPVLVVDDDAATRRLFVLALGRAGLDVIEAAGGQPALEIIEQRPVAVVICDLLMPGMTGIDVVRSLRGRAETATLPVILVTGSGDADTVIEGLDAGANDFLAKPVRLDELVARTKAHIRTQAAWTHVVEAELHLRAGVVAALGAIRLSSVPEETAGAVVEELSRRTASDFVSVAQVTADGRMQELATYNRRDGIRLAGETFHRDLATYLLGRVQGGPWVDEVRGVGPADPTEALRAADLDLVASAPIYSGDDLVGLLSIGAATRGDETARHAQARLLAAATDYASVLSAVAGAALAGRREALAQRATLEAVLDAQAFRPVFQPIVDVETREVVGFEALTRFADGVRPDVRFGEATRVGLGAQLEIATLRAAIAAAVQLPPIGFVSVNLSPRTLLDHADEVKAIAGSIDRDVVVELTEHVPIDDYQELRAAFALMGERMYLAVDDAGAGYSSLRHIIELQPAFAKLDISLVRGIDTDDLRQSLAAGLNYYALRTGCRLIAEGVETVAEANTLSRLGVEFAQGYLYGRPAPAAELAT